MERGSTLLCHVDSRSRMNLQSIFFIIISCNKEYRTPISRKIIIESACKEGG